MGLSSPKPTSTGPSATESANAESESKAHTGIVVGSAVAGTSFIVLALTGVLLILRRRRKRLSSGPKHELPEDRALAETDAAAEKKHPKELWADHAAVEMGRNSRFEDSLPNQGMMQEVQNVRGVNPLIRIHYV